MSNVKLVNLASIIVKPSLREVFLTICIKNNQEVLGSTLVLWGTSNLLILKVTKPETNS
jgi:hypothetical protein